MPHAPVRLPLAVRAAIIQHLRDRRGAWPISLSNAVKVVRDRCPDCEIPNDELVFAIAEEAIENGLNLNFDGTLPH
jgi:hypothetical protein